MFPAKDQHTYQYNAHNSFEPQELPAETARPAAEHRYSELQAESSTIDTRRFSELPAEANMASELPTPDVSPMPIQEEFSNNMAKRASLSQQMSVGTGEASRNR
jgi:hypothetical protein